MLLSLSTLSLEDTEDVDCDSWSTVYTRWRAWHWNHKHLSQGWVVKAGLLADHAVRSHAAGYLSTRQPTTYHQAKKLIGWKRWDSWNLERWQEPSCILFLIPRRDLQYILTGVRFINFVAPYYGSIVLHVQNFSLHLSLTVRIQQSVSIARIVR